MDTFLIGVGHFCNMISTMPSAAVQQWEVQCQKMESLLLKREDLVAELAESIPIEDLKESIASLSKDLDGIEATYVEGKNVLVFLTSQELNRENELKRNCEE